MPAVVSRRASLRLTADAYADVHAICSVTIGVDGRAPIFGDRDLATDVVEVLRRHAARTDVAVWAYCVMPDHVHLVLTPSATCDIVSFVGQFKSLALRAAWKRGVRGTFWQPRFWDHFARSDDDAERVVRYVLENPVRAGLVAHAHEYAFSGAHVACGPDEKCGGQAPALRPIGDALTTASEGDVHSCE